MIERITAGIDWISCTLGSDDDYYHEWRSNCYRALEAVAEDGYQLRNRRLMGFEGHSAGNCFVGENERGSFVQFTGEKADQAFHRVYYPTIHISRIDLQVTVKRDNMDIAEGRRSYREAMRANASLPEGRRRKLWFIEGSDGGYTCYVGSTSSDERARIYNKEIQSEDIDYKRCWRYEVVLRNDVSTRIGREIARYPATRADIVVSITTTWLNKRGINIRGLAHTTVPTEPIERTKPTDVEAKLRWLREQVAPTIRYLNGLGMREVVLDCLGLSDVQET